MTTTAVDPVFIDTNVLVYANSATAPLRDAARIRLNGLAAEGAKLWISRQILREYLATMTRTQMLEKPVPATKVIEDVQRFGTEFTIAEDGPTVTAGLLALLGAIPMGGKQIHDANIVATMLASGLRRLLTHNVTDFRRFSASIEIMPLEPEA
jgi:predicted nucleic acid-binding protein